MVLKEVAEVDRPRHLPTRATQSVPGVIAPAGPKVPGAKLRVSQEGFQRVLVCMERVPGVLKGVQRGRPPELPALVSSLQAAPLPTEHPDKLITESGRQGKERMAPRRPPWWHHPVVWLIKERVELHVLCEFLLRDA